MIHHEPSHPKNNIQRPLETLVPIQVLKKIARTLLSRKKTLKTTKPATTISTTTITTSTATARKKQQVKHQKAEIATATMATATERRNK